MNYWSPEWREKEQVHPAGENLVLDCQVLADRLDDQIRIFYRQREIGELPDLFHESVPFGQGNGGTGVFSLEGCLQVGQVFGQRVLPDIKGLDTITAAALTMAIWVPRVPVPTTHTFFIFMSLSSIIAIEARIYRHSPASAFRADR